MDEAILNLNLREEEYFKPHDELIWFNEKEREANTRTESKISFFYD
jgi:hypothetical protein